MVIPIFNSEKTTTFQRDFFEEFCSVLSKKLIMADITRKIRLKAN